MTYQYLLQQEEKKYPPSDALKKMLPKHKPIKPYILEKTQLAF